VVGRSGCWPSTPRGPTEESSGVAPQRHASKAIQLTISIVATRANFKYELFGVEMVGGRLKPQGGRLEEGRVANIENAAKMEAAVGMEWKLDCPCEHQTGPATIGNCKKTIE